MNAEPRQLVAVIGPESTGKTTLAIELAKRKGGVWLPEYARDFLTDTCYTEEDVLAVTREQIGRELDFVRSAPRFGVLDTDGIVLRVWLAERFGHVPTILEKHLERQASRIYLLMYPDLAWEYDRLREAESDLKRLFDVYESTVQALGFPYDVVSGVGESRTLKALALLNERSGY